MKPIEEQVSESVGHVQQTLIERLRTRASIRRNISTRKSVQEGKPDRIADLLEEAADRLEAYEEELSLHESHREYQDRIIENLAEYNRELLNGTK